MGITTKIAAIYDPYLDTLGGGERYCLTVAEILIKNGWQVDLFWSGESDFVSKAATRFSLNLNGINIVPDIFLQPVSKIDCMPDVKIHSHPKTKIKLIRKIKDFILRKNSTQKYDVLFYLSDGSIPTLFAKKNFLHIQVPFIQKLSRISQLKTINITKFICNSEFTASYYKNYNPQKISVVYPPVDIEKCLIASSKEKVILSVGRFDNLLNAKKQDILINAFEKFNHQNPGWQLVLAGGSISTVEENHYLKHLKYLAKSMPISFKINPSFIELIKLYSQSQIYWHAAGFETDEKTHPESTEHFGISVVEAMASGAVPVVVNKGGLPEIVKDSQNGFLWDTIDQLVSKTQLLVGSSQLLKELSVNAIKTATKFSKKEFEDKFIKIINE